LDVVLQEGVVSGVGVHDTICPNSGTVED
jgi:hypothetical protein